VRRVNTLIHKAEVTGHGNVFEPLQADNGSVPSEVHQLNPLVAVEFIVEALQPFEGKHVSVGGARVAPKSGHENPLDVTEPPLGHRLEADVKDHILITENLLNTLVKINEYLGGHPIIGVGEEFLHVPDAGQFRAQIFE